MLRVTTRGLKVPSLRMALRTEEPRWWEVSRTMRDWHMPPTLLARGAEDSSDARHVGTLELMSL